MSVGPIAILMPHLAGGGAERVAVNLANTLAARGYAIDMVLLQAEGHLLPDLSPTIRLIDLKAARFRGALWPLVRYLRCAQPQSLLANMWPLTMAALWARLLARVPTRVVVVEHTTWSRSELLARPTVGWQVRTSMRLFYPHAGGVVAVSQGAADDLAEFTGLPRSAITAIYNPVVGAERTPSTAVLAPTAWWNGKHKRVLAVGTLKPIKEYGVLIEAFSILARKIDARLLILGEGEQRTAMEAQIRRLGLQDRMYMPGFVKDAAPYFERADLHVLSSSGEGFGNVIVEALACGTPVVSTDCRSGPREILADGRFGTLVPVGDAAALAAAMHTTLEVQPDRAALRARAQDFSIDKAVDQYLKLLVPHSQHKVAA